MEKAGPGPTVDDWCTSKAVKQSYRDLVLDLCPTPDKCPLVTNNLHLCVRVPIACADLSVLVACVDLSVLVAWVDLSVLEACVDLSVLVACVDLSVLVVWVELYVLEACVDLSVPVACVDLSGMLDMYVYSVFTGDGV